MQDGLAVIRVNDIEVGSMPISQYDEVVKSVKKDWRLRCASVFCFMRFVCSFIFRLWAFFIQSSSVVIAMFMVYSIFHPAETALFVTDFRNATPERIAEAFHTVATICVLVSIIAYILNLTFIGCPVFVSASENAINKKIREVMEVPSEGQIKITFKMDGLNSVR